MDPSSDERQSAPTQIWVSLQCRSRLPVLRNARQVASCNSQARVIAKHDFGAHSCIISESLLLIRSTAPVDRPPQSHTLSAPEQFHAFPAKILLLLHSPRSLRQGTSTGAGACTRAPNNTTLLTAEMTFPKDRCGNAVVDSKSRSGPRFATQPESERLLGHQKPGERPEHQKCRLAVARG